MKSHLLIFVIMMFLGVSVRSQGVIREVRCFDSTVKREADSIKKVMANNGFIIVREASMSMESGYEMPVIVPLTEGTWYQFSFIGDLSSKLFELRMFDYNEKQVVYQKHYGQDAGGNIISFSYIPKFTEYHILKPVQINKKKKGDICGYIMMFKKVK
ncbi:MAG: hypothetical protein ABI237_07815 [Ginsengibacter sp.]